MKKMKLRNFILAQQAKGEDLSPSVLMDEYNKLPLKKKVTLQAVSQMLQRMGLNAAARNGLVVERARAEAGKDIMDYAEVSAYLADSKLHATTQHRIDRVLKCLRELWNWMGRSDVYNWTQEAIIVELEKHYPTVQDSQDRMVFNHPAAILEYLSAVNTVFKGIVRKNFSVGLRRGKRDLFDYFRFEEFNAFCNCCFDTDDMRREGWEAAYIAQVNMGSREGSRGKIGLLGLRWEDVNFEAKRCKIREKGGHGKAGRAWNNVPLDLFPWLNGWIKLMLWHELQGKPFSGQVFPVKYKQYLINFHEVRKRTNGRIAQKIETMRPHILRRTHAQWLKKLHVPLEVIAGRFPDGIFGVGWDNLNILKDTYTEIEPEEYAEASEKADKRMKVLGLT